MARRRSRAGPAGQGSGVRDTTEQSAADTTYATYAAAPRTRRRRRVARPYVPGSRQSTGAGRATPPDGGRARRCGRARPARSPASARSGAFRAVVPRCSTPSAARGDRCGCAVVGPTTPRAGCSLLRRELGPHVEPAARSADVAERDRHPVAARVCGRRRACAPRRRRRLVRGDRRLRCSAGLLGRQRDDAGDHRGRGRDADEHAPRRRGTGAVDGARRVRRRPRGVARERRGDEPVRVVGVERAVAPRAGPRAHERVAPRGGAGRRVERGARGLGRETELGRGAFELAVEVGAQELVEGLGVQGLVGAVHGARRGWMFGARVFGSRRSRVGASWSASAARPRAMRDRTVPGRDVEHSRDLGVVEADEIAQRDRGAVLGREMRRARRRRRADRRRRRRAAGPRVARLGQRSRPAPGAERRRRASSSAAFVATR